MSLDKAKELIQYAEDQTLYSSQEALYSIIASIKFLIEELEGKERKGKEAKK